MRSKARTLTKHPTSVADFPVWNYDGSSTQQATTEQSEVWLKPVFYCLDPFQPVPARSPTDKDVSPQPTPQNYLVLCETVLPNLTLDPTHDNHRRECEAVHTALEAQEIYFGIEQEFILTSLDDPTQPLCWDAQFGERFRGAQGPYYCSVGASNSLGRQVSDSHYRACLYAGLAICGTNLEVFPGQLEYQIGPCVGVDIGDQMWVSRYILLRVCELYQVNVTFDPKPVEGWSGSGLHTNISTKATRADHTGYDAIVSYMPKFAARVNQHMAVYGRGNERRLTGLHETQAMDKFDYAVGSRACSIRIPRSTFNDKKGYFEDRRVASNADPYQVATVISKTCFDLE